MSWIVPFEGFAELETNYGMDFASCVERVMSATDSEPRHGPSATVEELDETLDRIAVTSSFSSVNLRKRIKERHAEPIRTDDALSGIFRLLNSSEAKWMVRMLLKDYGPVHIPETLAMQQFHFLLPDLLTFQNSFDTAVKFLQDPLGKCPLGLERRIKTRLEKVQYVDSYLRLE
jgi:DNA ligase 4